jgi:dihydroflavonol-4-reductase
VTRVFVTGGNGFIGSAVVRALVVRGHAVRCLLRSTSDASRLDGLPIERVPGDVRDAGAVHAGLAGCEAAVHLAGPSAWNVTRSPEMPEVVVGGTRNLLESCRRQGIERVVFASSVMAIGASERPQVLNEGCLSPAPISRFVYVRAKRAAEVLCRRAADEGLGVVVVNPGEVYGPHDTALVTAGNLVDFARSSPVLACRGGVAVTHVDDVAAGILAALDRGRAGERYILAGENVSIAELAALTVEILGRHEPVRTVPTALVRPLAWMGRTLGVPMPFDPEVIPYATLYWFMDSAKARGELGVSFRSARETLTSTLAWLVEAGHIPTAIFLGSREVRA